VSITKPSFFAPNVLIMSASDLYQAIQMMNSTQYGLVSSVFTQDRKIYDQCLLELDTGLINWNESTLSYSLQLPFRGLKKSGSYFPTTMAAPLYSVPVSSLETPNPVLNATKIPGLNWDRLPTAE